MIGRQHAATVSIADGAGRLGVCPGDGAGRGPGEWGRDQASAVSGKPIEHRVPTPGTVRQLYGTAFACAKPGCRAGLYTVNADTGQHVLNSHVAHIHARSEGGPRWDPAMSEADNRDVSNLVLLCFPMRGRAPARCRSPSIRATGPCSSPQRYTAKD